MQNSYLIKIQGQEELQAGTYYEVDFSKPPIGEGGMGRVYKGVQVVQATGVKRPVAIKFLYDGLPQSALDRAIREASIKIKCENLVEMIAFVKISQTTADQTTAEHYHVVSELLEGVMLHDLINGKTVGPDGEIIKYAEELYNLYREDREFFAIEIAKKVLSGLMYLHDAGYVHRDIDPSNIMITADRKIKLIDFGVAHKMVTQTTGPMLTHVGSFLGKGEYAAPELVLGDVIHQNPTTDIYSVGILLFQLLTGELPFTGSLQEVMQMQREQEMPVQKIKNAKLRKVVGKATQKKQADRYQSAAEFRVALDAISCASTSLKQESTSSTISLNSIYTLSNNEDTSSNKKVDSTQILDNQSTSTSATSIGKDENKEKKEKEVNSMTHRSIGKLFKENLITQAIVVAIIGLVCGILLSYILM